MTTERIGSYPIEREIGRGGMDVVYLGRDTRLDRPVAIKVLPEVFASDPERLAHLAPAVCAPIRVTGAVPKYGPAASSGSVPRR